MAENTHHGEVHHSPTSEAENFGLHILAEIYGIEISKVRELVAIHGYDRAALDAAAEALRKH